MTPAFTPDVKENVFLKVVPASLHKSKMYKELLNDMRAANLKEGSIAPDISGRTTEGKEFSLSDFGDKYILLDFWASWCNPCRKEIPNLKKLYKEYADKGFQIISISIDKKKADWEKALKALNIKIDNQYWVFKN